MSDQPVLNQGEKHALIHSYAQPYGVLIETGLWNGWGATLALEGQIAERYAIDADYENVVRAREKNVEAFTGNSATMLPALLRRIWKPACFWLDAHYAVEGDDYLAANPCPLLAELDAILNWPYARDSTVLIDDLRLMGSPGWPTLEEVRAKAREQTWTHEEAGDVMRLTPVGL